MGKSRQVSIWLRPGLGEGGIILSPEELRLPGTQAHRLD